MCNHEPGTVIAIGPVNTLRNRLDSRKLPGVLEVFPLLDSHVKGVANRFSEYEIARLKNVPHGMEILTVSRMSSLLAKEVSEGKAVVDLNYDLPWTQPKFRKAGRLALSEPALRWAAWIRNEYVTPAAMQAPGAMAPPPRPLAMIDSGLDPVEIASGRPMTSLDYSTGWSQVVTTNSDVNGHGTRVAKILDQVLPPSLPLVSAKIGNTNETVTVLSLLRIFAELVAGYHPSVVNLSLSPRDDQFVCGECGQIAAAPTFIPTLLPFVIRLAPDVLTVMAAGNSGDLCNQDHPDLDAPNLLYAVALDTHLSRASYSSYPGHEEMGEYAFGGDGSGDEQGYGVFEDDRSSFGTSFAAPFVSARAYLALLSRQNTPVHRSTLFPPGPGSPHGPILAGRIPFFGGSLAGPARRSSPKPAERPSRNH